MGEPLSRGDLDFDPADVLFVGQGRSAVGWYRCYLPAMFMGADWIGLEGDITNRGRITTGQRRREDLADYKVVIVQQPRGYWLPILNRLKQRGIKVLFENDDYLHGIRKMADHDYAEGFSKKRLREYEVNMRVCDGLIVSTEFIERRYRNFNKNVWLAEIGLDLARYRLTRPPRPTVNIGWSGGTGHKRAAFPWLHQVGEVMAKHPDTCFVSVGQDFANGFIPAFGPARALAVPFMLLDNYPAAMALFDVALAPAGKGDFFKGKSDLRWLEAAALGIPVVGDPTVYWRIEDGVTGMTAETPEEAREKLEQLVADPTLRQEIGQNAREELLSERTMDVAVYQWVDAIEGVLALD